VGDSARHWGIKATTCFQQMFSFLFVGVSLLNWELYCRNLRIHNWMTQPERLLPDCLTVWQQP
jgi:hypothetical protein